MDLVDDLKMVKSHFYKSMKHLGLMSQGELDQIFGPIDVILPIHQSLIDDLKDQRLPDGTTEFIGDVLKDWAPKLEGYQTYCANLVHAKPLLESKKQCPAIEDFLERCQECNFSRKLDLWTFLDVPRNRLVKYPLLLKSVVKYTPSNHVDHKKLDEAVDLIEDMVTEVDKKTGEQKCEYAKERLEYLSEDQRCEEITTSNVILCDGVLKNNRGTKLHVFLFEKILVLTRLSTRTGQPKYQIHRNPLPVKDLHLQTQGEGKHGSFRTALSTGNNLKFAFKVSSGLGGKTNSHTLIANDEHEKRHWLANLRTVLPEGHEDVKNHDQVQPKEGIDGLNTSDLSFGIPATVKRSMSTKSDNTVKTNLEKSKASKSTKKKRRSTIATETVIRETPEGCAGGNSSFVASSGDSKNIYSCQGNNDAVDLDHHEFDVDKDESLLKIPHIDSPVWTEGDPETRGSADGQEDPSI